MLIFTEAFAIILVDENDTNLFDSVVIVSFSKYQMTDSLLANQSNYHFGYFPGCSSFCDSVLTRLKFPTEFI